MLTAHMVNTPLDVFPFTAFINGIKLNVIWLFDKHLQMEPFYVNVETDFYKVMSIS